MPGEIDLADLARIRKAVESCRAARDRALGERDQWLARLKEEFGAGTEGEAEEVLAGLERDGRRQGRKASRLWEEFRSRFPKFAGE